MAITVVGTTTARSNGVTLSQLTPTLPAGVQAGDLLVVKAVSGNNSPITVSGYTSAGSISATDVVVRLQCYTKIAGAGETAPVVNFATSDNDHVCVLVALRGAGALSLGTLGTRSENHPTSDVATNVATVTMAQAGAILYAAQTANDTAFIWGAGVTELADLSARPGGGDSARSLTVSIENGVGAGASTQRTVTDDNPNSYPTNDLISTALPVYEAASAPLLGVHHKASTADSITGGLPLVLPKPGGTVENDRMIVVIAENSLSGIGAPAGWTLADDVPILNDAGANNGWLHIYEHVATANEPATTSWDVAGQAAGTCSSFGNAGAIAAISAVNSGSTNVLSMNSPSVTAALDASALVIGMGVNNGTDFSFPAGVTEADQSRTGTGAGNVGMAVGYQEGIVAGATGTRTITNTDPFGHLAENSAAFALVISPEWHDFTGDFETSDISQFSYDQAVPGRLTIVTDVVEQGTYAARFEVQAGDAEPDTGDERCELLSGRQYNEDDNRYFRILGNISSWDDTHWGLIWQMHDDGGGSPPIALFNDGGQLSLQHGAGSPVYWTSSPITYGVWFEVVIRIVFSTTEGVIELWFNGVKQTLTGSVETITNANTLGLAPGYDKLGIYRSADSVGTAVIYHDDYRISDTFFSDPPSAAPLSRLVMII